MRETGVYVKFMKREEREIFACYYEALSKAKMPGQRDNLEHVRANLIEGNRDLTKKVWNNFLENLMRLDCDYDGLLQVLKTHPTDPGKGNCYKIPSKDKDQFGHMKQMRARSKFRAQFREMYAPSYGFDPKLDLEEERPTLSVIEGGIR